MMMYICTSLYK